MKNETSCAQTSLEAWCYFVRDRRWGDAQKRKLLKHFETPEIILQHSIDALARAINSKPISKEPRISEQQVSRDLDWLQAEQNSLLTLNCSAYPILLKQLPDPPIALFAIGDLAIINEPQVAIVGSRRPTPPTPGALNKVGRALQCWAVEQILFILREMLSCIRGLLPMV